MRRRATPTAVTRVQEPSMTPSHPMVSKAETSSACVFVHTSSLHFDLRFEHSNDKSFSLAGLASSLPVLRAPDAGHQPSVRGLAFVEDESKQYRDADTDRSRPSRRADVRLLLTSAAGQSRPSPKTLYIFQVKYPQKTTTCWTPS